VIVSFVDIGGIVDHHSMSWSERWFLLIHYVIKFVSDLWHRAPDNFQVQRVITLYFWKWWVFAYFLCTVVLSTSEKSFK
jgi:hypothetical protein